MTSQLNSLSLTTARSMRLSTLADIETSMKKLSTQEDFLKQSLREAAPASVAQFLDDEGTIEDLFKYGQSSRKILYSNNSYGLKSATQVKEAFLALKNAWQGAAEITFSDGEPHRIEVFVKIP